MTIQFNIQGVSKLKKEMERLSVQFPDEVRKIILETAIVDIESYAKTNDIPIDTGRLRSSIHTKYTKKIQHNYSDNVGNTYDGTIRESIDINSVVVGTNVEYAQKINRLGGGGQNSGRTSGGLKRDKGFGKGFFDKAWINGKKNLNMNLNKLMKRVDKI